MQSTDKHQLLTLPQISQLELIYKQTGAEDHLIIETSNFISQ